MAEIKQQPNIDNSALEAEIASFREEMHPTKFNTVLKLAQTAKFFCPATLKETPEAVEKEDGTVSLEAKKDINLFTLTNKEGKRFIAVFTNPAHAQSGAEKLPSQNFAILGISELHAFLAKTNGQQIDGVVINPFTTSFVITTNLVMSMGAKEMYVPKQNEQVKIIGLAKYPDGFIDEIKEKLDEDGRVKNVWLAVMERSTKARSLVAVVEHDDLANAGVRKELFDKVASCFMKFQGMHLMFVPYGEGFAQTVIKDKKPCYERED